MRPILSNLKKQYNLGPWLGGFKDLASRTMIYVAVLSFTQISATFYYTTLKPIIAQYAPWMSFGIYFTILVIFVLVIMLIEYKFIVPSSYTFNNYQEYQHRNPIRENLEGIKEQLKDIKEIIERLENESRNNSSSKSP